MTTDTPEQARFREEARGWLAAHFPPSLAGTLPPAGRAMSAEQDAWRRAVGGRGWGTPTWPAEYGGGGLGRDLARVLSQELDRIGAYNPIEGLGVILFGPTLLEFGTEEQKQRLLPPICRNDVRWCQGFSEPGAGSDLASLQTRADDHGDHFVINGQKVWTSDAIDADMCFCLVRTDRTKKHGGISFVAIDMHQPGVEVRPLRLINDTAPFCETFFTDAVTGKDNLIGPLNGGWAVAKALLLHERQGAAGVVHMTPAAIPGVLQGPPVDALAREYIGLGADGALADADLRQRLVRHLMDEEAFELTSARERGAPTQASSVLKNVGSKLRQDKCELAMEIMGYQGLGWDGDAFTDNEKGMVRTMLRSKSATIAGGTWEVQLNIIAKRILGLPDPKAGA